MKKSFIMLTLCFLAIIVQAQSGTSNLKMPSTFIMPDGSIVPAKRLDSIQKVFGGRDIIISFVEGKAYVHPAKTSTEQLESETKLNLLINKPAPEFAFKDIDGTLYSLSDLKGKIVVLNFWFTQCGGCINELPDLNALKRLYKNKDVVFLAVTFDDESKIKVFLSKNKFDYTIIPNAKKMCLDYNIYGYPTSLVMDRNGIVTFVDCSLEDNIKSRLTKAIDEVNNTIYTIN